MSDTGDDLNSKELKYIYVVLVKAHTGLGKVARRMSGYEYTHIAISLDERMEEFISFSRRRHFAPFDAGFMREKREHYAFGDNKCVKLKVFRIPVGYVKYDRILREIKRIELDESYVFNFYSMITMSLVHGIRIKKAHNCMSFVAGIIKLTGAVRLEKPYYRYDIKEMDELLSDYLFCEKDFYRKEDEDITDGYMDKVSIVSNIKMFISLNKTLTSRIIMGIWRKR